jgi:hypothetical protein
MQNKHLPLLLFMTLVTLSTLALPVTLVRAEDNTLIQDKASTDPQQPQVKQMDVGVNIQDSTTPNFAKPLTDAQVIERVAQAMGETVD